MSTRSTLKAMFSDSSLAAVIYVSLGLCAVFICVILFVYRDSDNGTHSWRGGSGPSTVCFYETRSELSGDGKTSYPVQYTVCRDAR